MHKTHRTTQYTHIFGECRVHTETHITRRTRSRSPFLSLALALAKYDVAALAQGNNRLKGFQRKCIECTVGVLPMCFFGVGTESLRNIHVPDALDDVVNTESRNHISPLPPSASLFTVAQLHTERVCVCSLAAYSVFRLHSNFRLKSKWMALRLEYGMSSEMLKCWNAEILKCTFIFNRCDATQYTPFACVP